MRIGTYNTFSFGAATSNRIGSNKLALDRTAGRLATGNRIRVAADDAAGLGTSEKKDAAIRSMGQGLRNLQHGKNLLLTTEGAVGAVGEQREIIKRARELAVQSSSETLSSDERAFLQAEVNQLLDELDRIAEVTNFSGTQLLNRPGSGGGGGGGGATPTFSAGPFVAHQDATGNVVLDSVIQENITATFNGTAWDVVGDTTGNIGTATTGQAFISAGNNVGVGAGLGFTIAAGTYDTGASITVAVTNGGTATFAGESTFGGNYTGHLLAGDLDGDNDIDIIGQHPDSTQAYKIWLNNGSGGFSGGGSPSATKPLKKNQGDLGDIDGDGDLDIVNVNTAGSLTVWKNDGSANFTASSQAGFGGVLPGGSDQYNPVLLQLQDVDNDGDQDILAKNNNSISVLKNDGAGNFSVTDTDVLAGHTFDDLTFADFNADGFVDYATGANDSGAADIAIGINQGDGSFNLALSIGTSIRGISHITSGDFDLDGDTDVVGATGTFEELFVFSNDGSNAASGADIFDTAAITEYPGQSADYHAITSADLDDDGDLDVAAATRYGTDRLELSFNDGAGDLGSSQVSLLASLDTRDVVLADFNNDGSIDVLASKFNYNNNSIWLNNRIQTATAGTGDAGSGGGGGGGTSTIGVTLSGEAADQLDFSFEQTTRSELGLDNVFVNTAANARSALDTLDTALDTLSQVTSNLGSYYNRLEYAERNLEDRLLGANQSYSQIKHADIALEASNWAREKMLFDSSVSLSAQFGRMHRSMMSKLIASGNTLL